VRAFLLMVMIACGFVVSAAAAGEITPPASANPVLAARSQSAHLIMVDDPACHYCRRWNREVGNGYARTAEGRAAPLRRVGRDAEVLSNFAPVIYTPTFILVRGGREVGRITGYPGQLYFWEELSALMSSAGLTTKG
jgi:hypothetical protein